MRRLLSILLALVILATVAGTSMQASAGSQRSYSSVTFALDYRGTVSATWRNWSPVIGGLTCRGHDSSGAFTSSVRPGSQAYTLRLYKDLGGRKVLMQWKPENAMGLVTSNRTAQGWLMRYSGGQCSQVPRDQSGCGAQSFTGQVALESLGGSTSLRKRLFLHWATEEERLDCSDGITYDRRFGTPLGQRPATVLVRTLYGCGIRKGRSCKITIGGTTDYPFQVTQNETTYTSNVRTEWSVTFRVLRRS